MTTPWELLEGDCMDLLDDLAAGSIDACVTDPPYSSGGMVRGDRTASTTAKYVSTSTVRTYEDFSGDNRDQRAFLTWCDLWLRKVRRVLVPGGLVVVWTDWRQLPTVTDAVQVAGFVWRGVFVWSKPGGRPVPNRPANSSEFAVWASNGPRSIEPRADSEYPPGFVVCSSVHNSTRRHMTEKPVEVLRPLTRLAPAGGLVLDPFAGSGSTGVAALAEGRRFLGFELSPEYADGARRRLRGVPLWNDDERQTTLLELDGAPA